MNVNQYCAKVSAGQLPQSYTMTNCESITTLVFLFYFPKWSACLLSETIGVFKRFACQNYCIIIQSQQSSFIYFFSPSDHIAQMFFLTSSLVEGNQFLTDGGIGQQQWIHLQKGSLPDDKPKAKKGN